MANQIEKRLNYFNGQFLDANDLRDEQIYHIDRRRGHIKTLHLSGVTDGLIVSSSNENPKQISISSGTAIDYNGQQIVLSTDKRFELEGYKDESVFLVISFHEEFDDPQKENNEENTHEDQKKNDEAKKNTDKEPQIQLICKSGVNQDVGSEKEDGEGKTRIHEQPKIEILTKRGEDKKITLAELTIDGNGHVKNANNNVRQYSGLRLPGPNNGSSTLRTVAAGRVDLSGRLQVTGLLVHGTTGSEASQIEIENGETHLAGKLTVEGKTKILSTLTVSNNSTLNSDLIVHGTTTLNEALTEDEQKPSESKLIVNVPTNFNNSLTVTKGQQTTLQGRLTVDKLTTLQQNLIVGQNDAKNSNPKTKLVVYGATELYHSLTVGQNDASKSNPKTKLVVHGATELYHNLTVEKQKPTKLTGTLTVEGATTLKATLTVGEDNQSGRSNTPDTKLIVHGATTLKNGLKVKGSTELDQLTVTKELLKADQGALIKNVAIGYSLAPQNTAIIGTTKQGRQLRLHSLESIHFHVGHDIKGITDSMIFSTPPKETKPQLQVPGGAQLNGVRIGVQPSDRRIGVQPSDRRKFNDPNALISAFGSLSLKLYSSNAIHFHVGDSEKPRLSIDNTKIEIEDMLELKVKGDLNVNGKIFLNGEQLSTQHMKAFDDKGNLQVNRTGNSYLLGSLGIGKEVKTREGMLQIINDSSNPKIPALILGSPKKTYLELGYKDEENEEDEEDEEDKKSTNYSWIQSGRSKNLFINPNGNSVGIGSTETPGGKLHITFPKERGRGNHLIIGHVQEMENEQKFDVALFLDNNQDEDRWPFGIIKNGKILAAFDTEGTLFSKVTEETKALINNFASNLIANSDHQMISQMDILTALIQAVNNLQEKITHLKNQTHKKKRTKR